MNDNQILASKPMRAARWKRWLAFACAGAVVTAGAVCAYFFLRKEEDKFSQAAIMDVNGQLSSSSREEEMKKMMDDSMVAVSINSVPYFENGAAKGNLQIENLEINKRLIQVHIYLDSDLEQGIKDKPIYAMNELMPPNSHIKEDVLSVNLSKGKYPATAYFTTYDINEPSKYLGQASVGIEINVGK